jgi:hypothetical protein
MYLRKIGEGVDWVHLAQDRDRSRGLENTVMNLLVTYEARNLLTS